MKIQLLETFIAIAEARSISKAAEKVHRTQAALSLQIKKLEESVGQVLLLRDNRGVVLTDHGETLLNYAYKIIKLNDQALNELKQTQNREIVRLGVPTDYINHYISCSLLEFIREFTFIDLVIDSDVSGNLFKRLDKNEFDVIVATHWLPPTDGELLFERQFKWVKAYKGNAHLREVIPMALYPENCPIRAQVFANHQLSMRPVNVVLSTPSPDALCMAVEFDLAIAPIAEFRINDRMTVLDPNIYNLPVLPVFNESIYLNPNKTSHHLNQLYSLLKASPNRNSQIAK